MLDSVLDNLTPDDYIDTSLDSAPVAPFKERFFSGDFTHVVVITLCCTSYDKPPYIENTENIMRFFKRMTELISRSFLDSYELDFVFDELTKEYQQFDGYLGFHPELNEFHRSEQQFHRGTPDTICNFSGTGAIATKIAFKEPNSIRKFIWFIYSFEDALRYITSKYLKDVQIYSRETIKKSLSLISNYGNGAHFKLPTYPKFEHCRQLIIDRTNINLSSENYKSFYNHVTVTIEKMYIIGLYKDVDENEKSRQVMLAFVDYIYRHKDKLPDIFIKKS